MAPTGKYTGYVEIPVPVKIENRGMSESSGGLGNADRELV
jgi:hypothetical protein